MARYSLFILILGLFTACAHNAVATKRTTSSVEGTQVVLNCAGSGFAVTATQAGAEGSYQLTLAKDDENLLITKTSTIYELTQPGDFPFNNTVKLDLGKTMAGITLRFILKPYSFYKENMLEITAGERRARLTCEAAEGFKADLQETLKKKTAGAM